MNNEVSLKSIGKVYLQRGVGLINCAKFFHISTSKAAALLRKQGFIISKSSYKQEERIKKIHISTEEVFRNTVVVPYLIEKGHKIIRVNERLTPTDSDGLKPRPDLISTCNGIVYITEVKGGYPRKRNMGSLQTVIGQLIVHQFMQQIQNHNGVMYQAVFPSNCRYEKFFSPEFLKFLHELEIEVLFL